MGEKKSNLKLLWYILGVIITVGLCYMFLIVYFYFISPYNVSLKIKLNPFLSENSITEMYKETVVDINCDIYINNEKKEKTFFGVNIREDGYIVSALNELYSERDLENIKISTISGSVYGGEVVYKDSNFNLILIKCFDSKDKKLPIKMSYISSTSKLEQAFDINIFALTSVYKNEVWTGVLKQNSKVALAPYTLVDGYNAVEYIVEDCAEIDLNKNKENSIATFDGGIVFDKRGNLFGISYEKITRTDINSNEKLYIMPLAFAFNVLSDVVNDYENNLIYENKLVSSFRGMDGIDVQCYKRASSVEGEKPVKKDYFYFNGKWVFLNQEINDFYSKIVEDRVLSGYFLVDDLVYNGTKLLDANSIIDGFVFDGFRHNIKTKVDLFKFLHSLKTGDKVIMLVRDAENINFVV